MYFPFRSISCIDILLLATLFNWFNNFISLTLQNHIYLWYIYISLNHLHLIYIYILYLPHYVNLTHLYILIYQLLSNSSYLSYTAYEQYPPAFSVTIQWHTHCIFYLITGLMPNYPVIYLTTSQYFSHIITPIHISSPRPIHHHYFLVIHYML